MLKIGEFAKICSTNAQTLRFYDQEGVLKADYVDNSSGYRYYKPEKLTDYQRIIEYKEAGFTLDEIKQLMKTSPKERKTLIDAKRLELQGEETALRVKMAELDRLSENSLSGRSVISGCFPLTEQLYSDFEDDSEVIGRWTLVGSLPTAYDLPPIEDWTVRLAELIYPSDGLCDGCLHKSITFLPGGANYWVFFWSRGILYRISSEISGRCIANPYEIRCVNSEKLMLLKWVMLKDAEQGAEVTELVYRQENSFSYSETTVRLMRDDVNIPFVPDTKVLGTWAAVDYVQKADDFMPSSHPTGDIFYTSLVFHERGICYRGVRVLNGVRHMLLSYTNGYVINRQSETLEKYEIRDINGEEYLFVQHKSGDYIYGAKTPHIYVYRREILK